jgi:hypothetical protein
VILAITEQSGKRYSVWLSAIRASGTYCPTTAHLDYQAALCRRYAAFLARQEFASPRIFLSSFFQKNMGCKNI